MRMRQTMLHNPLHTDHPIKPTQPQGELANRYVEAAVEHELHALASAPRGCRANTAFRAAAALGRFVPAGLLDATRIQERLVAAACLTGMPEREARGHIARGLHRGAQEPAVAPTAPWPHISVSPSPPRRPPRRPDPRAVRALWEAAAPVTEDPTVVRWCENRALDAADIADWDLARALPQDAGLPNWARTRVSGAWTESGHRLLVPLLDADGRLASVRARCIHGSGEPAKSLAPAGFSASSLVFACPLARRILADGPPDWWTEKQFVVSEGEADWLTWASRHRSERSSGPAYLGISAGSWADAIAARIPSGSVVFVRTDPDEAGHRYAGRIAESLGHRCEVLVPPRRETCS